MCENMTAIFIYFPKEMQGLGENTELNSKMKQLQNWISQFFNKNRRMIASDVGSNKLIGKVTWTYW